MAGQVKRMIDRVIAERARGNPTLVMTTRTKLLLKGIRAADFGDATPDDPAMIARVRSAAAEMGVSL